MDRIQRLSRMLIAATKKAGGEITLTAEELDVDGLAIRFDERDLPGYEPVGYTDLQEGDEIEVQIDAPLFPQIHGDWEHRTVVAIDARDGVEGRRVVSSVTFHDGEREYEINPAKDKGRRMRRGLFTRGTVLKVITHDEAIALGRAQRRLELGPAPGRDDSGLGRI